MDAVDPRSGGIEPRDRLARPRNGLERMAAGAAERDRRNWTAGGTCLVLILGAKWSCGARGRNQYVIWSDRSLLMRARTSSITSRGAPITFKISLSP